MALTQEELQGIISSVLASIRTNSRTIDQLTPVTMLSDNDCFEINGGKKVSYKVLRELIVSLSSAEQDSLQNLIEKCELESVSVETTETTATITIKSVGKEIEAAIPLASEDAAGLMTAADKFKLNKAYHNVDTAQTLADSKGEPDGIAPLDENGLIPSAIIPGEFDEVVEFDCCVEDVNVALVSMGHYSTDPGCMVVYNRSSGTFALAMATVDITDSEWRVPGHADLWIEDESGYTLDAGKFNFYANWLDGDCFGTLNPEAGGRVPLSGKLYVDKTGNSIFHSTGGALVELSGAGNGEWETVLQRYKSFSEGWIQLQLSARNKATGKGFAFIFPINAASATASGCMSQFQAKKLNDTADAVEDMQKLIPVDASEENQLVSSDDVAAFCDRVELVIDNVQNQVDAQEGSIEGLEELVPPSATVLNKLADRAFVNSSIATSTADFRGTFDSVSLLQTVQADANDYAFVRSTDSEGNTVYTRYKYTSGVGWEYEYELNNSSFTAAQWAAINSEMTAGDGAKLRALPDASKILLKPTNGTNKQFIKADGSVDSSVGYGVYMFKAAGSTGSQEITTSQFLEILQSYNAFTGYWIGKANGGLANNDVISDSGCGKIELAGSVVEVISTNFSTSDVFTIRVYTQANKHTEGLMAGAEFIYQKGYSNVGTGWRRNISIKEVGTSSQFIKADGTVDSTSYLPANSAAVSADKLTTARNIVLEGAVSGSASFDGSGDVVISTNLTLGNDVCGAVMGGALMICNQALYMDVLNKMNEGTEFETVNAQIGLGSGELSNTLYPGAGDNSSLYPAVTKGDLRGVNYIKIFDCNTFGADGGWVSLPIAWVDESYNGVGISVWCQFLTQMHNFIIDGNSYEWQVESL